MGSVKELAKAGQNLRARRLRLGLTLGDVYRASLTLARELGNPAFILPASRVQQIEARDFVPSIHRLYALSHVYKCRLRELLSWYGIPPH